MDTVLGMNVRRMLADLRDTGGFSYNIYGEQPLDGYMVSLPNYEWYTSCLAFDAESITTYLARNFRLLSEPTNYLGCWQHGWSVYLDISRRYVTLSDAMLAARSARQLAIYHVDTRTTLEA